MMSIALSYHNTCLMEEDVLLLNNGQWLNDKLIGFMFEYFEYEQFMDLAARVAFVSPEVTQFIKLVEAQEEVDIFLEPLSLKEKDIVFFAVNNNNSSSAAGGSHWSLLMFVNKSTEFHHYDSSNQINEESARDIVGKVFPHTSANQNVEFKFIKHSDCSQQTNSYDCGVFVIFFTEQLCLLFREDFLIEVTTPIVISKPATERRKHIRRLIAEIADRRR